MRYARNTARAARVPGAHDRKGASAMRRSTIMLTFAGLLAAGPALGDVVIRSQDPNDAWHERRAQQERTESRWEQQEAQRKAAMGNYRGALQSERESRQDMRDAMRHERRANDDPGVTIYGK